MGDLAVDTAVKQVGDGRCEAMLSEDWRIWGPAGGYTAAIALRAAATASPFARPASFFCQFHAVAEFDTVELKVTTLRQTRSAAAHRVEMTQGERIIVEATVWSVEEGLDGLVHDVTEPPAVVSVDDAKPITAYLTEEELAQRPRLGFWSNFDQLMVDFRRLPSEEVLPPIFRNWARFSPSPTFDDPWVDACRSLVLIDVQSWPSAARHHGPRTGDWYAPSLDLYVAFHKPRPEVEWLLCDGFAPVADEGLIGWNGRLWTPEGALVASGSGQLLSRRMRRSGP